MGEGWSRTGKGTGVRWASRPHEFLQGPRPEICQAAFCCPRRPRGVPWGRLAPAQPGGLALAGALIRSSFLIVDSEDISNLF